MKIEKIDLGILRLSPIFSKEKRKKVLHAIEELNYTGKTTSVQTCVGLLEEETNIFALVHKEIGIIQRIGERYVNKKLVLVDLSALKLLSGGKIEPHCDTQYDFQGVIHLTNIKEGEGGTFCIHRGENRVEVLPLDNSALFFGSSIRHEVKNFLGKAQRTSIVFGFSCIENENESRKKVIKRVSYHLGSHSTVSHRKK